MKHIIHCAAGGIAMLIIATFWLSTIISEMFGSDALIAQVKTSILYGMALLIPAMIIAGGSGNLLGKGWRLPEVARKSKRMKIIAANGLLVLVPLAIFLAWRAQNGLLDAVFYTAQGIELLAGATNLTLLALNMRDGVRLRARRIARKSA